MTAAHTDMNDYDILSRAELIQLLVTADGKGTAVKLAALNALFGDIDEAALSVSRLELTWNEIKTAHADVKLMLDDLVKRDGEKDAIIKELTIDRDNWKKMTTEYQRLLDNRGLI